jgi:hypothetical protein
VVVHTSVINHKKYENGKQMRKKSKENYYRCIVCSAKYNSRQRLRSHLKKHLNSKSFPCSNSNCVRKFSKRSELNSHLKFLCKDTNKTDSVKTNEKICENGVHISSIASRIDELVNKNTKLLNEPGNSRENNHEKHLFNPMEFIKSNYKKS